MGQLSDSETDPLAEQTPDWLALVDHLKVKAFVELTLAESIRRGVEQLIRVAGIGAMKPNTILLGFRNSNTEYTDDLSSSSSPFFGPQFEGKLLGNNATDQISQEDYVGIIQDVLKLHKNIGLCRNFQMLDRTEVFSSELKFRVRAGRKRYLDVWPLNFLNPGETDVADNTSLFMFQVI